MFGVAKSVRFGMTILKHWPVPNQVKSSNRTSSDPTLYEGVGLSFQISVCLMNIYTLRSFWVAQLFLFYASFFSKATILLTNTIWPWTLFRAPCTYQTPTADGYTKSNLSLARKTWLVILKWWRGLESNACPLTKPDVEMEGKQWTQP